MVTIAEVQEALRVIGVHSWELPVARQELVNQHLKAICHINNHRDPWCASERHDIPSLHKTRLHQQ